MVQFLSLPVLSCAVINWLLSKCLTSAPNERQTSDNKIDPLHFKKESFNWKISINGSVGFYRSKYTAVSALSLRAQAQWRLFEPNISCSMHPVGRNFLCNRVDISKAIQFWPRSERRLILCVFSLSLLFQLTPLNWNFLWNWLYYACDRCLWLVILWMHDFWLSNRRSEFYWIGKKKKTTVKKIKWKKAMLKMD